MEQTFSFLNSKLLLRLLVRNLNLNRLSNTLLITKYQNYG